MGVITVLTGQSSYLSQLPTFTHFHSRKTLTSWVRDYELRGYRHPITFSTHNNIVVPDEEHWKSGQGLLIPEHLWFFERPMTRSWANDIALGFEDCEARYVGMHVRYRRHRPDSPTIVGARFKIEQITAWLHLFSPDHEMKSIEHVFSRLQRSLVE